MAILREVRSRGNPFAACGVEGVERGENVRFITLPAVFAALVVMLVSGPVLAGGWAVTELDEPIPGLTAGEPVDVGFTVRQHGKTPVLTGDVGLWLHSTDGAVEVYFPAEPDGAAGHYLVTMIAPQAGTWQLLARQGSLPGTELEFEPYPLGTHQVVAAVVALSPAPEPAAPVDPGRPIDALVAGLIGAAVGAMAGIVGGSIWRRRPVATPDVARSGI